MAKAPLDPNRPIIQSDDAGCVPPTGLKFVPVGSNPGDILYWDGFNWITVPYPATPNGQILTAGTNGPFWANP